MAQKKSWSEMTPSTRKAVAAGGVIETIMTVVALRDLKGRSKGSLRGPKWLWVLLLFVQPVGPIAYFMFGRRR